jgi:hypothetical protein
LKARSSIDAEADVDVEEIVQETTTADADGNTELPFFINESDINDHRAEDGVDSPPSTPSRITTATQAVSRRDWLRISTVLVGGVVVGGATIKQSFIDAEQQLKLQLERNNYK